MWQEDYESAAPPSIVDVAEQSKMPCKELVEMLQDGTHALGGGRGRSVPPMIIDVRDEEFSGGSIEGAQHYPSTSFELQVEELCEKVHKEGPPCVIFYCLRSQLKAPQCCHRFQEMLIERYPVEKSTRVCVLKGGFVDFLFVAGPLSSVVDGLDQMYWELDITDDGGKPFYMGY